MKRIRFEVYPAEPQRVVIHAADGKAYEAFFRMVVVDVFDQETTSLSGIPNILVTNEVKLDSVRALGETAELIGVVKLAEPGSKPN